MLMLDDGLDDYLSSLLVLMGEGDLLNCDW